MIVPPRLVSSSGISEKRGFRWTCGTWGLRRLVKPLMKPYTSTRRLLARVTAPPTVAFRAGVSPPAVRIPIRLTGNTSLSLDCTTRAPPSPRMVLEWAIHPRASREFEGWAMGLLPAARGRARTALAGLPGPAPRRASSPMPLLLGLRIADAPALLELPVERPLPAGIGAVALAALLGDVRGEPTATPGGGAAALSHRIRFYRSRGPNARPPGAVSLGRGARWGARRLVAKTATTNVRFAPSPPRRF